MLEIEAALAEASDARTSATAHAQGCLKALLLINGGAVVAILAFVGTLKADSAMTVNLAGIRFALSAFALGVCLAAFCGIALSWFFDTNEAEQKAFAGLLLERLGHDTLIFTRRWGIVAKHGGPLALVATLLVAGSAVSFGVGALNAIQAIQPTRSRATSSVEGPRGIASQKAPAQPARYN